MPTKQRLGLVCLSLISLIPCIAGLLRLYYVLDFYDSVDELCTLDYQTTFAHWLTDDLRERKHYLGSHDGRNEHRHSVRLSARH